MQVSISKDLIHPHKVIKGLSYVRNFISKQEETQLIENILKGDWNTSLKRRTQHYGHQYLYDRKNQTSQAPPLPEWSYAVKKHIQQLFTEQICPNHNKICFDQMIINEYQPGQGINPHIDNPKLFLSPIVSLSLGSQCIMEFDHEKYPNDSLEIKLNRRSIFIIDEEARYEWKHSIPARKKDQGKLRNVRYSLTFRIMKKQNIVKNGDKQSEQ